VWTKGEEEGEQSLVGGFFFWRRKLMLGRETYRAPP